MSRQMIVVSARQRVGVGPTIEFMTCRGGQAVGLTSRECAWWDFVDCKLDLFPDQDVSAKLVMVEMRKGRDGALLRWTMKSTGIEHQG